MLLSLTPIEETGETSVRTDCSAGFRWGPKQWRF